MAHFAPLLTRWLYFLGGAMLTLAVASGMVLWIVKRRERAPLSIGNRMLERLNVGGLVGVPIGMVAFLVANRLLPLGMTARAEAEVSVALWSAGAALLLGLALTPKLGWPLLLGLLSLLCALAALLGPIWASDVMLVTCNAMLLATAVALGLLVWKHIRRRSAPTPVRRRAIPA